MFQFDGQDTPARFARMLMGAVIVSVGLSGCAATIRGEPEPTLEPGRDLTRLVIDATLDSERIRTFVACGAVTSFTTTDASGQPVTVDCSTLSSNRVAHRNEIIYAQMAEITELYNIYERRISRELRESGFLVAVVQIALGSAGALVGESASQVLSAASAALAGADQAFTKEVLVESTIQAFQEQMRARRDAVKARILRNTLNDMSTYPLQAAIADLSEFRQAGTLTGALLGIAADSTTTRMEKSEELREAEKVIRVRADLSATSLKILDWINAPGVTDAERNDRRTTIRTCFSGNRSSDPEQPRDFASFLAESNKFPVLEAAIVACMKDKHGINFNSL